VTPPQPAEVLAQVLASFKDKKKPLNFKQAVDRHRGFFVWRRAELIVAGARIEWTLASLVTRVLSEHAQVNDYVSAKVKALSIGGHDKSPPHLDLHDVVKAKIGRRDAVINAREKKYRAKRVARIRAIAWRAAGIHDTLWNGPADPTISTLDVDALEELVDRRLRIVERMNFQVGRFEYDTVWFGAGSGGVHGPWNDGFRQRMFEQSRIPREPDGLSEKVVAFVGGGTHVAEQTQDPFKSGDPEWRWERNHIQLLYNVAPSFLGPNMVSDWEPNATNPQIFDFAGLTKTLGTSFSKAVELMFTPDVNWWGRNWLPDGHVIAALELEALLFALRRRYSTATDDIGRTKFDALASGHPKGFVAVGDPYRLDSPTLMSFVADGDPHFYHFAINNRDLQVGDHVGISKGDLFGFIGSRSNQGEQTRAIVLDVDSDPTSGGIDLQSIRLQAPSSIENPLGRFLLEEIVAPLNDSLDQVRAWAMNQFVGNASVTRLRWNGVDDRLVRWEPYGETFGDPGAWWVAIDATLYGDAATAIRENPGAITGDPQPGPGYKTPPIPDAVFYPLSRPDGYESWLTYFDARRKTPVLKTPKLIDFAVNGSMVRGDLLNRNQPNAARVLRPQVVP
jgi:hypothetical protein